MRQLNWFGGSKRQHNNAHYTAKDICSYRFRVLDGKSFNLNDREDFVMH